MFYVTLELITIWEFYFFANILEFITWIDQHSFTSTLRIVELSMPLLALRGVLDFTHGKYFWTIKAPQDCAWGHKSVLKLRNEIRRFIKFDVGDGRKISYDMIIRILFMRYSFRIIHGATTISKAKMDYVLKNKIRVWKPTRSNELITIQCQLCLVELKDDKGRWSATRSSWLLLCSHLQWK